MTIDFTSKVAIVTGGASGIGAALVRILVAGGAKVIIADLADERGAALSEEIGEAAVFKRSDVALEADGKALADMAISRFGRIDMLYNNAGKGGLGRADTTEPAAWRTLIEVNLTSAYLMSRAVLPHMRAAGGGSIVNTCSVSGMAGDYNMLAYNAAKGGLINLTRAMALDHAAENIRVNAVCPGVIGDTAMTARLHEGPGGIAIWDARIPLGRTGTAIEVARLMAFLGSELASYMTGAVVPVDGGLTCHTGMPSPADFEAATTH